jgi:glycogen debranching enzyme
VQGYVFAAKRHAAAMAEKLGDAKLALQLLQSAEELRTRFDRMFWCEELRTYALALDGDKRACKVRASNAGHALFTGIATPQKAARVATTLLAPDMFSGWGVRTIASGQARYNPMSYHNGSIWPHDNALIAMGLARYGFRNEAARILSGIFDAGRHQDMSRLPELFCGFDRRPNRAPTPYPVACSPQAWSAASAFGLLGSCLGLELNFERNEILLRDPLLPEFLDEVTFSNLRLGASHANIRLRRHGPEVTVDVQERGGDARVVVSK